MEQYNFRLKEYRKIALKFYLAPWRVLGIDKSAAKLTVRLTPHRHPRAGALGRRSQAHATKKTTRTTRKTKPKARRRGAVPANPLGDRLPLFPPRNAFFHWLYSRSMYLLNLLFRSAMVA